MVALVTLDQARRHLRIYHQDEDLDVQERVQQASEIVIDYIQRPDHGWSDASDDDESNAPKVVQAAVLLVLAALWEHRGDGEGDYQQADGYLSKPVTALLHRIAKLSYA